MLLLFETLEHKACILKNSSSFLARQMLQIEKTVPQSQILNNPSINDKSFQLNYIQRFRERNTNRDSSPPTPNPLTPFSVVPNIRERNLSALTNFSGDGDDEAEKDVKSDISQ